MKNTLLVFICATMCLVACQQEQKKVTNTIPGYQEMQQVAGTVESNIENLHTYQGAIRDMLHSFEASFPKDTFTVKLRSQLSELNKVEYSYNIWKKTYNANWDTIKADKNALVEQGKSEATSVKNALLYNIESSKKLITLLKDRGIIVSNDPTINQAPAAPPKK
jgi:hypothetical protein